MKIMLNNEDTRRFRQHRENFAKSFFRTFETKIEVKSQHEHKIRSGLRHSIPKTYKIMSEQANLYQPTVLAHDARIYSGLRISWCILYCNVWQQKNKLTLGLIAAQNTDYKKKSFKNILLELEISTTFICT